MALRALIYPYWNVNNRPHLMMRANGEALIYPYWNVNTMVEYNHQNEGGL